HITVDGTRAAALLFHDPRYQGLLHFLRLFVLVQGSFAHSDLREHLAPLLGQRPSQLTPGRITYHLRRLRLHGLIERIPKSYRYRITAKGLRTAIFAIRRGHAVQGSVRLRTGRKDSPASCRNGAVSGRHTSPI